MVTFGGKNGLANFRRSQLQKSALYQGWRNIAFITYVGLLKMSFSKSAKLFCFQLLENGSAVLTKQILKTPFILSGC